MIVNLSDMLLHESRLTESRNVLLDFASGGRMSFVARQFGVLHMVLSGTVLCRPRGADPIALHAGDSIVFFYRDPHILETVGARVHDSPDCLTDWPDPSADPRSIPIGQGPTIASVFSSLLQTAYLPKAALSVRAAPDFWLLRSNETVHPISFDTAQLRQQCQGPGAAAFANALTSLLLVQVVRNVCAQVWGDRDIQVLAPTERQIAAAMREISTNISRDWTVETLARQVGISRSAFAKAFHQATGETPMAYITAIRMQRAADLLVAEGLPMREVAERVGYRLETSFSRAFKRFHGTAPRRFLRPGAPPANSSEFQTHPVAGPFPL